MYLSSFHLGSWLQSPFLVRNRLWLWFSRKRLPEAIEIVRNLSKHKSVTGISISKRLIDAWQIQWKLVLIQRLYGRLWRYSWSVCPNQWGQGRGLQRRTFLSMSKGGYRCEACSGDGIIKVRCISCPDVYVPCEVCHGTRYNSQRP